MNKISDKVIYTTYAPDTDITFIMEDTVVIEENEEKFIKTKVKGFYYGESDKELTKKYYEKLVAYY